MPKSCKCKRVSCKNGSKIHVSDFKSQGEIDSAIMSIKSMWPQCRNRVRTKSMAGILTLIITPPTISLLNEIYREMTKLYSSLT